MEQRGGVISLGRGEGKGVSCVVPARWDGSGRGRVERDERVARGGCLERGELSHSAVATFLAGLVGAIVSVCVSVVCRGTCRLPLGMADVSERYAENCFLPPLPPPTHLPPEIVGTRCWIIKIVVFEEANSTNSSLVYLNVRRTFLERGFSLSLDFDINQSFSPNSITMLTSCIFSERRNNPCNGRTHQTVVCRSCLES